MRVPSVSVASPTAWASAVSFERIGCPHDRSSIYHRQSLSLVAVGWVAVSGVDCGLHPGVDVFIHPGVDVFIERDRAVELTAASLTEGELKTYPSYVSPWLLHVFPDQEILKRVAQVDEEIMRIVATEIHELTRVL